MNSSVRVNNLYPCRKQFYRLEDSTSMQFLLPLVLQTIHFQSTQVSTLFLLPPLRLFHMFVIQLGSVVTFCILSQNPLILLNDFFQFVYDKVHSQCCEVLQVLTNPYCHVPTFTIPCMQYSTVHLCHPNNPLSFTYSSHSPPSPGPQEPVIFVLSLQFSLFLGGI